MAACEECWAAAQRDVMLLGGSVVDRYQRRIGDAETPHAIERLRVTEQGEGKNR